jgi:hypothetical protein
VSALEYTAESVINHAGEFRLSVRTHARLRRPNLARVVFYGAGGGSGEVSRVRVCDGRTLHDRTMGRVGEAGRTVRAPFRGVLTADIAHPLDEAAYAVEQFFRDTPFLPPRAAWGNAPGETALAAELGDAPPATPTWASKRAYKVMMTSGDFKDTVWVDAASYCPVRLSRVGDHAGRVQETLTETYVSLSLNGARFPRETFQWTDDDERGIVRDSVLAGGPPK